MLILLAVIFGVLVTPRAGPAQETFTPNPLPPHLWSEADSLPDLNQRNCCNHRDCIPALVFVISQGREWSVVEINGRRAQVPTAYVGLSPTARSWVCIEPQYVPALQQGVPLAQILAENELAVRCVYIAVFSKRGHLVIQRGKKE